jgi:hypothetical protein
MKKAMIGLGLALMVGTSIAAADCPSSNGCSADAFSCGSVRYTSCVVNCYYPELATCTQGKCGTPSAFAIPNNCYCRKP